MRETGIYLGQFRSRSRKKRSAKLLLWADGGWKGRGGEHGSHRVDARDPGLHLLRIAEREKRAAHREWRKDKLYIVSRLWWSMALVVLYCFILSNIINMNWHECSTAEFKSKPGKVCITFSWRLIYLYTLPRSQAVFTKSWTCFNQWLTYL